MQLDEHDRAALEVLYHHGMDPLTAVRLARTLEVSVPAAQACLTHLEQSGLIERPTGSSYPFFHLTPTGVGVFWVAAGGEPAAVVEAEVRGAGASQALWAGTVLRT